MSKSDADIEQELENLVAKVRQDAERTRPTREPPIRENIEAPSPVVTRIHEDEPMLPSVDMTGSTSLSTDNQAQQGNQAPRTAAQLLLGRSSGEKARTVLAFTAGAMVMYTWSAIVTVAILSAAGYGFYRLMRKDDPEQINELGTAP